MAKQNKALDEFAELLFILFKPAINQMLVAEKLINKVSDYIELNGSDTTMTEKIMPHCAYCKVDIRKIKEQLGDHECPEYLEARNQKYGLNKFV